MEQWSDVMQIVRIAINYKTIAAFQTLEIIWYKYILSQNWFDTVCNF